MFELQNDVREAFPPTLARQGRKWVSIIRYWHQLSKARKGYQQHTDSYSHPFLFVAGLPKSGTSWIESMLASFPGYHKLVIPEAIYYELRNGGSHDFDLPADTLNRLEESLAVLKLHVHGSAHNVRLLHEAEVPYVVLYRDLRDVAVSHYFYARRTPWHPEYEDYAELDIEEALLHFGRTLLPDFVDWMRSWRERRDSDLSLELRYEDLLDDTDDEFKTVASHFCLDDSPPTIERIVAEHLFKNMSDGRLRGEEDEHSFARKGVAGDWQTHFTDRTKDLFKTHAGQALIDFGYETNQSW